MTSLDLDWDDGGWLVEGRGLMLGVAVSECSPGTEAERQVKRATLLYYMSHEKRTL